MVRLGKKTIPFGVCYGYFFGLIVAISSSFTSSLHAQEGGIHGSVVNRKTGKPLHKVIVRNRESGNEDLTDSLGRYSVSGLDVNRTHVLEAFLADYEPNYTKPIKVNANEIVPADPFVLTLNPIFYGSIIRGRFFDEEGSSIPFAHVLVVGTTIGAAANAAGEYTIARVPAGTHDVRASAVGFRSQTRSVEVDAGEIVMQDFFLATDVLRLEAVVVSGTPGGVGMRKRDASFAITTVEASDMVQFSPSSTASLMELIPGVWSESSGGIAGANIDVRGLPGGSDAPFVTMAINGAPLYGTETLSFFEQSSIFRIDETVVMAEAVRGGPSSVFSSGGPGVTMNFTLLRGGEETKARVKYSTSDYTLQRVDAVVSGKLTNGLYYMVGGYAQTSPGIRDAEFNAEKGQQFTAQLTKIFDRGVINGFTRMTNDLGQWILPMALNTGNDLGTFTQLGNATRFRTLQINGQGDSAVFDFSNGRGWKGSITGINGSFDLGSGWTVRDNLSYTNGEANTFGFVPDGNPIRVSELGVSSITTLGGQELSGSAWIQNYGHWVVLKDIESLTNDFSLTTVWKGHEIAVGFYQAWWTAKDFWTLGNSAAVHNVKNGDFIRGVTCDSLAANGSNSECRSYGIESVGDAHVFAFYAAESWQSTPFLRFDLGVRREQIELEYILDAGPGYPDGTRDMLVSHDDAEWAFTGAINYDLTENLGLFGRVSFGFAFPHFDNIRENHRSTKKVRQFEAGIKYAPRTLFSFFATSYLTNYDGLESLVGGGFTPRRLRTQSLGVELDGAVFYRDLTVRVIATLQSTDILESDDPALVGNEVLRQPKWQVRLGPSYNLSAGPFSVNIYGAVRLVAERFADNTNIVKLDSYEKIDAGVALLTTGGLSISVHIDNVTDSDALTEGDPRNLTAPSGRPIFGRSMKFSVSYDL
ncbi:MAG: TonB-dependent receptor [Ignavibacteriales bacterium]|nr:TonB-dependent receptor [Ignavibacteriales bacterium]